MFNDNQIEQLSKDIDQHRVKTRDKAGISLQYLETYDVINEANRVFNYMWNYTITTLNEVDRSTNQNGNHVITFSAIVKIKIFDQNGNYIERMDTGVGIGTARTIGEAIDNGSKSAISDSLKRCFRTMGSAFGNNLYSKGTNANNGQHQNYSQSPNNSNHQNYQAQNQSMQNTAPYVNAQDFSQLNNIEGISIMQQGDYLVAVGQNLYEHRDALKAHNFRFNPENKTWYLPIRQAA